MVTFVKRSRWRSLSTFCRCIWCAWVAFLAYTPTSYAEVDASNPQFAFRLEKSIQQNIIDELIYEASINQQATKENLIVLRNVRGQLMVSEQDVVRWKLPIINPDAAVNYKGVRYYATADLPAASYTVNDNQLTMDVVLPVSSFENTNVDMQREIVKPNPPQPGGFFNYDVFAVKTDIKSVVDGAFELGVFNQNGVGLTNVLVRDVGRESEFIRLETNWTIDQPNSISSLRIGDTISRGGSIGQSVRFGGLQYATNFATRPDLVTFPQLTLNGSAVLPSSVDVYLNNIKTFSQNVPPGPFTLNNLPVFTGSGEARLVVKDLFGREQVISQPYYASRSLLTEGLHDFSYETGFNRLDYATASDNYQDFFASVTHRYGFNNHFTAEAHGEWQSKRQLLSVGSVYLMKNIGVADATIAASNQDDDGSGQLISIGYERQGSAFGIGARTQLATEHFSQLGQLKNDSGVARLSSVFVGWQQAKFGSLSVSYINQLRGDADKNELLNISYSRNLFAGWFLSVTALKNLENSHGNTVLFNITKALDQTNGQATTANINATHSKFTDIATMQIQRNLPVGTGFGYRLLAGVNDNKRVEAGLSAQSNVGTYSIEVANAGNQQAYRANISGGMAYVPGHLMFARRLNESFAVVDVGGYAGVRVYSENQLVGRTDVNGMQLIPNLRSYQRNNISIEPQDIKLDAAVGDTKTTAIPYFRSADYIKFSVQKVRAATLRVIQKNGQFVPSGAIFTVKNSQVASYPVAQNGLLYISDLDAQNLLSASWVQHLGDEVISQQCLLDLAFTENTELVPDLGEFVCK